jgi:hypothetical protein
MESVLFREATFDTGKVVLNYAEGSATEPSLVFLHGGTGRWQLYSGMLGELAKCCHVYACQSPRYTTERSSAIVQKYCRHECNHLWAPCRNHLSYAQSQSLAARRTYGWKENPPDGYPQSAPPFAGHHQSE